MPAMAPKFMNTLHFQADGSLDVCGPTNEEGGGVVSLTITRLVVADHNGNLMDRTCEIVSVPGPAVEWEADFDGADGKLVDGPAIGLAIGYLRMQNGSQVPISWAQAIRLTHKPEIATGSSPPSDVVSAR
jgi:hypothetical protein